MNKKILITNDDGITADGIIRLAKAAVKYGEVWVVAPESQRSAASHSITLRTYIEAKKVDFPVEGVKAYAVTGMPGDCVRIGVLNIVPGKPDVIFSGINFGYNCATDLQYSATAGAAFEGAFQGITSIAFSEGFHGLHETTDDYLDTVIKELVDMPFEPGIIWNVNFPECKREECKGIRRDVTVSTCPVYNDTYNEEKISEDVVRFTVNGILTNGAEEGTDLWALNEGYVSIGTVSNVGVKK